MLPFSAIRIHFLSVNITEVVVAEMPFLLLNFFQFSIIYTREIFSDYF
jgi:hypothetical protein